MKKSYSQLAKERRENLKQQGLCINCGKQQSELNRTKCLNCLEAARLSNKKYNQTNPNAKEIKRRWKTNPISQAKHRDSRKKWRLELKYKVIKSFGGKCECCQEDRLPFLQIDHVNKDGKIHRTSIGRSTKLFRDMLKNPTRHKLRVLCANCHFAITNLGTCPHKEDNYEISEIQSYTTLAMVEGHNQ